MPDQTETLSVRHALSVGAPPDRAFDVFTTQMGSWWPLATYSTGEQPATDAIVEPREGGPRTVAPPRSGRIHQLSLIRGSAP